MIDVYGAKRLLIIWVPESCARMKWLGYGFCAGRLWVQWTPPTQEEVERRYREKTKAASFGEYSEPNAEVTHPESKP